MPRKDEYIWILTRRKARRDMGGHGGGGSSFSSPTDLSGLLLWLDFSDISTLYQDSSKTTPVASNNDPIGAAADKSGNGNDALQATAGYRPLYKTGIQNSLSAGWGDGIDDFMDFGAEWIDGLAEGTAFAVVQPGQISGTQGSQWKMGIGQGHFGYTGGKVYDDFISTTRPEVVSSGIVADTTYLVSTLNNGTNLKYWLNTVSKYDAANADSNAGYALVFSAATTSKFFLGYVMEIVVYNSALSDANRGLVENYLNNKWSVY